MNNKIERGLKELINILNLITKIKFMIPKIAKTVSERSFGHAPTLRHVTLGIYDMLGREVATLVNEVKEPGVYEVVFDAETAASGLSSGIYFVRLSAGDFISVKKMVLTK